MNSRIFKLPKDQSVEIDFGELEIKIAAHIGTDLHKQMEEWFEEATKKMGVPPGMFADTSPRSLHRQRFLTNLNKLKHRHDKMDLNSQLPWKGFKI